MRGYEEKREDEAQESSSGIDREKQTNFKVRHMVFLLKYTCLENNQLTALFFGGSQLRYTGFHILKGNNLGFVSCGLMHMFGEKCIHP